MPKNLSPTKNNVLMRIKECDLPISCIVDVGVERATSELIAQFPDKFHHLFEPVSLFYDVIKQNYQKIDHELYKMALSDKTGKLYCIVRALRNDGVPTHGRLDAEPIPVDGKTIVSCSEVTVSRFDSVCEDIADNYLLKLDVDGTEILVLNGIGDHLGRASVIIIETTFTTILERMTYIAAKGFQLVDIVDIVYYGNSLYQCDLVFIRSNLIKEDFRPPIQTFKPELWNNAVTRQ